MDTEPAVEALQQEGPHRISGFAYMGVALRAKVRHKLVPPEFWTAEESDERRYALISCRCGADTRVELGASPVKCECERWFFYDGTNLWALISPVSGTA